MIAYTCMSDTSPKSSGMPESHPHKRLAHVSENLQRSLEPSIPASCILDRQSDPSIVPATTRRSSHGLPEIICLDRLAFALSSYPVEPLLPLVDRRARRKWPLSLMRVATFEAGWSIRGQYQTWKPKYHGRYRHGENRASDNPISLSRR